MQPEAPPEPWLRGILPDCDPVIGHLLRASEQICEDTSRALGSLAAEELWSKPFGMTSAGFHAKHLAGSTHRLCTYLEGGQLSAAPPDESLGSESPAELLRAVNAAFDRYRGLLRELPSGEFASVRYVGRKRIEVTAIGLAIHIAEHGQRHTGQLINAAKLANLRRDC